MSGLEIKVDGSAISSLADRLGAVPKKIRPAIRMAVNDTGDRTRTPMKRALAPQTGLKPKVITAAVKTDRATDGSLTYTLRSRGGNIRLKYFAARETRPGVSAAPRSQRRVFAGTFMKAGWWPKRVTKPNWNGQVFRRAGGKTRNGKDRFEVVRSGVFIPEEMVRGATAAAFNATSARVLPERLAHHLGRAMGG